MQKIGGFLLLVFKKYIALFGMIILLVSCTPRKYEDISQDPAFENILNQKIQTKVELNATGVTFDSNYQKSVDYIFLIPNPGIAGPEVIFTHKIPVGSKFRIIGVLGHVKKDENVKYNIHYKLKSLNQADNLEYVTLIKEKYISEYTDFIK